MISGKNEESFLKKVNINKKQQHMNSMTFLFYILILFGGEGQNFISFHFPPFCRIIYKQNIDFFLSIYKMT